jgi:hypothetical protein
VTINGRNLKEYKTSVMTEEEVQKALRICPDLQKDVVKILSFDTIQALVDCGNDAVEVDRIWPPEPKKRAEAAPATMTPTPEKSPAKAPIPTPQVATARARKAAKQVQQQEAKSEPAPAPAATTGLGTSTVDNVDDFLAAYT